MIKKSEISHNWIVFYYPECVKVTSKIWRKLEHSSIIFVELNADDNPIEYLDNKKLFSSGWEFAARTKNDII